MHRRADTAVREAERVQSLLDVLDESIVVCSGLHVTAANRSFASLVRLDGQKADGLVITDFITDYGAVNDLLDSGAVSLETSITSRDGTVIPIEVEARSIYQAGCHQRLLEIRDIRERKESEKKISFLAHHDSLTGLPNRAAFHERLNAAVAEADERQTSFAIIWVDLDHFKRVNDVAGHGAGDQALCQVAALLRMELPRDALISRIGGDEFVVLLAPIRDALEPRLVAQQLRRVLARPLEIEGRSIDVAASLGLAVYPDDAKTAEELLRNADLALYQAKSHGRGRTRSYSSTLSAEVERRESLSSGIEEAVGSGTIQAHFQPVVSAIDGRLCGFEALARWEHPEFGMIPPPEFVQIAEEHGCINDLTRSIIQASIKAAENFADDVQFAINITAGQLNEDMVDLVRDTLRQASFNPQRLEIEVTEDALIHDFDRAAEMFSRLRALGAQIAMDDFGAGYTSMNNLRTLHFDRIKIDRVFTVNLPLDRRSGAIIRSLMVLARELDIATTVEGVETEDQLNFLNAEGCDNVQGFLFSRPLPATALADLAVLQRPRSVRKRPPAAEVGKISRRI